MEHDEYENLPEDVKMEILLPLSYDDIPVMCMVSNDMNKICKKKFFWVKKYIREMGKDLNIKTHRIDKLKEYIKYIYEIRNMKDKIMKDIKPIFDKYYVGNIDYANISKIMNDIYAYIETMIKYDFVKTIEEEGEISLTLDIMEKEEEEEYIKEILHEKYDDDLSEIITILAGYNTKKMVRIGVNDSEVWYYLSDSKWDIIDIIYEIIRKKYIIDNA
uniref:F-box family protein n=1 Tax=Pithovirus LCPAC101 TaxID=2506586 RepID=A0A481Z2C8_9VIRU|nr:MAG: F-box family protein [Pithovirus LCPAC101]